MKAELIAPCGMNCGICKAFLREKNRCPGCRMIEAKKDPSVSRSRCKVKNCGHLKEFCFNCEKLPCQRMKSLDKRYREKYGMSMLENLKFIKEKGMDAFLKWQRGKYTCKCGGTVCVHDKKCYNCGKAFDKGAR